MKKFFTLLFGLCLSIGSLQAQELDESFVFMDEEGEIIPNGATVVRNVTEPYDEVSDVIYSGISVLNVGGSTDYIKMTYVIERIDNGTYQICFPSTCNMQTATGTYQTGVGQLMADLQDIQSEWFPTANGTCVVTMTIETFTKQGLFPPSYVHKAYGPSVTVQFVKSSSASDDGFPYVKLADGVYLDGTTLYICNGVTSLGGLQINPSEIYCYAAIPPSCLTNTFTGYDATLHVPAASMVSYFTALYWLNFNNILSDAIEPLSVTMSTTEAEMEIGQLLSLSATVAPGDATPKTVYWSSSDSSVATVSSGGTVTAVAEGECDILATCVDKVAVCHVAVVPPRVTITLDKHEARLLPNHTITLTASCSPIDVDLAVTSSNPGVAIPRLVNGTIMVVGVAEGTATITVNAADGWGNPDSCEVTVYTDHGDVNSDGYVNISDVTALIDYLLSGNPSGVNLIEADCNNDNNVNISDVTTLIDYLLSGTWPWEPEGPITETFTINGVTFKMVVVDGGTFIMGASNDDADANDNEKPAHQVTLSGYAIGETEVTQALWLAVIGSNPSYFTPSYSYDENLQRPVEMVSWNDCQTFITKLNQITGKNFRLPTEAEWEFAARGGNLSNGYRYAGSNNVDDVAWKYGTSNGTTHAVGAKYPNELGLYDMSGNVYEWCLDWYGRYSSGIQTNPIGPTSGSDHVFRGGDWMENAMACRVSYRNFGSDGKWAGVGLRLALDLDNDPEFEEHEYVDLGLPSGTLWATYNVGATAPEEYGDYFAWGETEPKDVFDRSTYEWCDEPYWLTKYCTDSASGHVIDNKTELDPEDDAAYINWGPSWRMPSKEQFQELCDNCIWQWTQRNGVNGHLVTGPNGNNLFFPAAGYRSGSSLCQESLYGCHWSLSLNVELQGSAHMLHDFENGKYMVDYQPRHRGLTVRAVRVPQN
jgi:formylglycine-generating enzyme required for sulfatase activity